jgi:cyclophilin family peptidyl-prolyl cis-trans isomerase
MSSAAPKNPFKAVKPTKPVFTTTTLAPSNSTNPFGNGTSSAAKSSPFRSPFSSNTYSASSTKPSVSGGSSFGAFGSAAATQSTGGESGNENYTTRLIKFYETHNPSKVGTVDATLEKYKGKEDELFRKLEAKYAPQPTTPQFPPPAGTGPRCYLEFSVGNEPARRVVVKLYKDKAPLAAENFRCLCTGEITTHRAAGKPLRYLGSKVHRIVPGFCLQAGDFTTGNGRGGASIYQPNSEHGDSWGKFKDEATGFLHHSKKGLLSMANSGKNTNSSQFFFTLKAVPYLNGKHVVFGEIEEGMDVLEELGKVDTDSKTSRPIDDVVISSCGEIDASGNDRPSLGIGVAKERSTPVLPSFGVATGGAPVFGGSSSAFGSGGAKGSSTFGKTTTVAAASTFSLGVTEGVGGLTTFGGSSTSATGVFGSSSTSVTPAFGSPSVLGNSSNTSASSSKGGSGSTSTAAPVFGSPSTLGSGNTTTNKDMPTHYAPVFGSPSTLGSGGGKPSTSIFGSGGASAFGGTGSKATGGFWTLPASESSRDDEPVFGKPPSFGGDGGNSNQATGGFGALASSASTGDGLVFGKSSSFGGVGSSNNPGGGFGTLSASASTSAAPPVFGSPSAPGSGGSAFGAGSSSGSKPSIFGGASSAFGSSNNDKDKPSPFSAFSSSPSKGFSFGAATHNK